MKKRINKDTITNIICGVVYVGICLYVTFAFLLSI